MADASIFVDAASSCTVATFYLDFPSHPNKYKMETAVPDATTTINDINK